MNKLVKKFFIITLVFLSFSSLSAAVDLTVTLKQDTQIVESDKNFRVTVMFSKPVSKLNITDLSISGGSIQEVRKVNSQRFYVFVKPQEGVKIVDLQIEADRIKATDGSLNTESSNDLEVSVKLPKVETPKNTSSGDSELTKLLNSLFGKKVTTPTQNTTSQQNYSQTLPQTNYVNTQQVTYYSCNGNLIPTTQSCSNVVYTNTMPNYYFNPTGYVPAPSGYNSGYAPFGNSYNNFSQPTVYYLNGQPVVLYNNSYVPLSHTYYYTNPYFNSRSYYRSYNDYYDDYYSAYDSRGSALYLNSSRDSLYLPSLDGLFGGSKSNKYNDSYYSNSRRSGAKPISEEEYDKQQDIKQDREIQEEDAYDRRSDAKQDKEIQREEDAYDRNSDIKQDREIEAESQVYKEPSSYREESESDSGSWFSSFKFWDI
jgi:hypothetical protein